jgi:hypothetical protein
LPIRAAAASPGCRVRTECDDLGTPAEELDDSRERGVALERKLLRVHLDPLETTWSHEIGLRADPALGERIARVEVRLAYESSAHDRSRHLGVFSEPEPDCA